ncbi:hypothetical protein AB6A40_001594 [Gnathostoma spinigerum]|uniref:DNA repair metallo-beta-lactamase domain-containing protein n=1 Tax=Gnathostoma spinigerum TaxID=75299 RepID=A0ABD6E4J1_9BILA
MPPAQAVILENIIAVDYFARKRGIKYFFLTHAHSDHMSGLNKNWDFAPIYCSKQTAQILNVVLGNSGHSSGIHPEWITSLELNKPYCMGDFTVTLFDAYHVFGAVMFLFEGPLFKDGPVLCTGDFRADIDMLKDFQTIPLFARLTHLALSTVYLDTTYLNSYENEFPSKSDSVKNAVKMIKKYSESKIWIVCGKLGRERFLATIAGELREKIQIYEKKRMVMDSMGFSYPLFDTEECRISTCERSNINSIPQSPCHIFEFTMLYTLKHIAFWKVLSFYNSQSHLLLIHSLYLYFCYNTSSSENVHLIGYSDHSSPNEIRNFLSLLKFRKLCPLGPSCDPKVLKELETLSRPLDAIGLFFLNEKFTYSILAGDQRSDIFETPNIKNVPEYAVNASDETAVVSSPPETAEDMVKPVKCVSNTESSFVWF